MTHTWKTHAALLLTLALSLLLTACGSGEVQKDDAAQPETFRPAEMAAPPQEHFSFPYMGLDLTLPGALQEKMADGTVYMQASEVLTDDGSALDHAFLFWNVMTPEDLSQEIPADQEAYLQWLEAMPRIGTVGLFSQKAAASLDELTGCTAHTKLGETADGAYHYYLSLDPEAEDAALVEAVTPSLTEQEPYRPGVSVFAEPTVQVSDLGQFTTQDIYGKTFTQEIFAQHELTMVNLFATWCSPCIQEIPHLNELNKTMADRDFGVVGFMLDGTNPDGSPNEEGLEKGRLLAEKTGADYPFLLPDDAGLNGRLIGVAALPETFFVDRNGRIVGGTYSGARDLEGWTEIVEAELAALEDSQG